MESSTAAVRQVPRRKYFRLWSWWCNDQCNQCNSGSLATARNYWVCAMWVRFTAFHSLESPVLLQSDCCPVDQNLVWELRILPPGCQNKSILSGQYRKLTNIATSSFTGRECPTCTAESGAAVALGSASFPLWDSRGSLSAILNPNSPLEVLEEKCQFELWGSEAHAESPCKDSYSFLYNENGFNFSWLVSRKKLYMCMLCYFAVFSTA